MIIYLNPYCGYNKGRSKWEKIRESFRNRIGEFQFEEIKSPSAFPGQVNAAVEGGERVFIAAGGDGTVNLLLNSLMNSSAAEKKELVLGAVGLGSSNDFHKPFRPKTFIGDIPTRLNVKNTVAADVISVRYAKSLHSFSTRYCIINASIGITAQANALYNSRLPIIAWIQRISQEAAIFASALKTIFTYRNLPCLLSLDKAQSHFYPVTNLGVIKNPYFGGGLCYDTIIKPDDGKLGVNLSYNMSKKEVIGTLIGLYKKRFMGRPKTISRFVKKLSITSGIPFALEIDGEVVKTNESHFRLIPKAIRCCQ
jgi:diacylglycerol kinase family enzyme